MTYEAKPACGSEESFHFKALKDLFRARKDPANYDISYVGDDPVTGDLFEILVAERGAEEVIDFLEDVGGEGRLLLLYQLQREGASPRDVFEVLELTGRIVVDSRRLSPDYPGRVENEKDVLSYYMWELTNFKDYQGFMVKRDFWRFFDHEAFFEHRGITTFAHGGVFYVLMLWPYNYK